MIENIKVSPSLLDGFANMLVGKWANDTEENLIARINKKAEFLQTEAMHRGTAFHDLTSGKLNIQPKNGIYQVEWFKFDAKVVEEVQSERTGAFHEQFVGREIPSQWGNVWLYGYVDDIFPLEIKDMKTCRQYYQEGYSDSWQWKTYLYCAGSDKFTYIITDFANVYYEEYWRTPTLQQSLTGIINKFSEFIFDNKDKIDLNLITYPERNV